MAAGNSAFKSSSLHQQHHANNNSGHRSHKDEVGSNTVTQSESQLSEDIRSVQLDLPNQNVVKADTDRARFISKEHREAMQSLLTYFCKSEGVSYKQGINDVMAPFVWLAFQKHAIAAQQYQSSYPQQ